MKYYIHCITVANTFQKDYGYVMQYMKYELYHAMQLSKYIVTGCIIVIVASSNVYNGSKRVSQKTSSKSKEEDYAYGLLIHRSPTENYSARLFNYPIWWVRVLGLGCGQCIKGLGLG